MEKLPKRIRENGIDYVLACDYYIPDLRLTEETRPIGRWGRLHKAYLKETRPALYTSLLLKGSLWTYLADLNEQAGGLMERIVMQMKAAEGVTEDLKACNALAWVGHMNSIRHRAEEIVLSELIYGKEPL